MSLFHKQIFNFADYTVYDQHLSNIFDNCIVTEITAKIMINGSPSDVWKIISEINHDTKFWKGMMKIRNIAKDRNVCNREIILKNNEKCLQKIILFPMDGIHVRWKIGAIFGVKDIIVTSMGKQTLLQVEMNYKIKGVTSLLSRGISEELLNEAELALQLIKEEVEKKQSPIGIRIIGGPIHG